MKFLEWKNKLTFIGKNIEYINVNSKTNHMKQKKHLLTGIEYLIESILGLVLTIILFYALKNLKQEWSSFVRTVSLIVCIIVDFHSIWRSIKMKKLARTRKNIGKGEGISREIVYHNNKKTIGLIIKMLIIGILFSRPLWQPWVS